MFALHPDFAAASQPIVSLALCEARLQLDARFPWIILVPRIAGASGFEDVPAESHAPLMAEVAAAGRAVRVMGDAAGRPILRLNIALLGNATPQLHLHVIGRRADDPAWPNPVWGHGEPLPYGPTELEAAMAAARPVLESETASDW